MFATLRGLPTRRLRAYAYWHVARPLAERMDCEFVVRARGDVLLLADLRGVSGRTLAVSGLWEWNVGAVIQGLLRAGDVFVDVGANTGLYTVLGARLVGPMGRVYALEPGPSTFTTLRRNVDLNAFDDRVTALELAAGATDDVAVLHGPASGHDASSSLRREPGGSGGESTEVRIRPLHALIVPDDRERLRLVKIDVEGHEDDVLRGLEPQLTDGPLPAIVVEVHAAWNADAPSFVVDFCRRYGLRARWIAEDTGAPDERLAPADRELVLVDLGEPPDLSRIARGRYALLLEPRSEPVG